MKDVIEDKTPYILVSLFIIFILTIAIYFIVVSMHHNHKATELCESKNMLLKEINNNKFVICFEKLDNEQLIERLYYLDKGDKE